MSRRSIERGHIVTPGAWVLSLTSAGVSKKDPLYIPSYPSGNGGHFWRREEPCSGSGAIQFSSDCALPFFNAFTRRVKRGCIRNLISAGVRISAIWSTGSSHGLVNFAAQGKVVRSTVVGESRTAATKCGSCPPQRQHAAKRIPAANGQWKYGMVRSFMFGVINFSFDSQRIRDDISGDQLLEL